MKITLATIKSFIRSNRDKLYICTKSSFDGMVDCVVPVQNKEFIPVQTDTNEEYTLGIKGAWFVRRSKDYFSPYDDGVYRGYEIYNCCGTFILAVKREN